jgi:hypothetical protein
MDCHYFRRLNLSAAIVSELADTVVNGDVLYDAITKREYRVSERGFAPTRSEVTADCLHWSREASLSFHGAINEAAGRILVDASLLSRSWSRLLCSMEEKTGNLPAFIPVVGQVQFGDNITYCGLAVLRSGTEVEVITPVGNNLSPFGQTATFVCRNPARATVSARLTVVEANQLPASGEVVKWQDEDASLEWI